MEMEKVPAAGYKIEGLWIGGFQRKNLFKNILLPFKIISSSIKSRRIIKKFKPDFAIGTRLRTRVDDFLPPARLLREEVVVVEPAGVRLLVMTSLNSGCRSCATTHCPPPPPRTHRLPMNRRLVGSSRWDDRSSHPDCIGTGRDDPTRFMAREQVRLDQGASPDPRLWRGRPRRRVDGTPARDLSEFSPARDGLATGKSPKPAD